MLAAQCRLAARALEKGVVVEAHHEADLAELKGQMVAKTAVRVGKVADRVRHGLAHGSILLERIAVATAHDVRLEVALLRSADKALESHNLLRGQWPLGSGPEQVVGGHAQVVGGHAPGVCGTMFVLERRPLSRHEVGDGMTVTLVKESMKFQSVIEVRVHLTRCPSVATRRTHNKHEACVEPVERGGGSEAKV